MLLGIASANIVFDHEGDVKFNNTNVDLNSNDLLSVSSMFIDKINSNSGSIEVEDNIDMKGNEINNVANGVSSSSGPLTLIGEGGANSYDYYESEYGDLKVTSNNLSYAARGNAYGVEGVRIALMTKDLSNYDEIKTSWTLENHMDFNMESSWTVGTGINGVYNPTTSFDGSSYPVDGSTGDNSQDSFVEKQNELVEGKDSMSYSTTHDISDIEGVNTVWVYYSVQFTDSDGNGGTETTITWDNIELN